ncbi:hypothetical protein, partial [uncultured Allobaculum sp.]|uniref:hypothetical protein n=1 Tax=uncultured Allobaculum sp. TaxID=1187017 RepID=UPI002625A345
MFSAAAVVVPSLAAAVFLLRFGFASAAWASWLAAVSAAGFVAVSAAASFVLRVVRGRFGAAFSVSAVSAVWVLS